MNLEDAERPERPKGVTTARRLSVNFLFYFRSLQFVVSFVTIVIKNI